MHGGAPAHGGQIQSPWQQKYTPGKLGSCSGLGEGMGTKMGKEEEVKLGCRRYAGSQPQSLGAWSSLRLFGSAPSLEVVQIKQDPCGGGGINFPLPCNSAKAAPNWIQHRPTRWLSRRITINLYAIYKKIL